MVVEERVELKNGLKNVYFDRTEIGLVDPKGRLLYRGYNIHDLAEHSTFEETVYLLLYGSLPTSAQLEELDAQLKASQRLPDAVFQVIHLTKDSHPMDVLRTAVSAMSVTDPDVLDISPQAALVKGLRLTAVVPTIVATHDRLRNGEEAVAPRSDLSLAANFLYMLSGREPTPEDARLIDKDLILHAEHGVNASAFAARVAASTEADFYAAITAGIAVLKGPKHGGAAEGAKKMALEIDSEDNAQSYISNLRKNGERIMGFGHPVYKAVDPRSVHMRADAKALGERMGQPKWFSILQAVTKVMEPYSRRGHHQNVDLWSGAIYSLLNIPDDLFVPIFAMGRMPGWTAHVMEQYSKKDILRPRLHYAGPIDLEYLPIGRRS
jgi:citrate synthase